MDLSDWHTNYALNEISFTILLTTFLLWYPFKYFGSVPNESFGFEEISEKIWVLRDWLLTFDKFLTYHQYWVTHDETVLIKNWTVGNACKVKTFFFRFNGSIIKTVQEGYYWNTLYPVDVVTILTRWNHWTNRQTGRCIHTNKHICCRHNALLQAKFAKMQKHLQFLESIKRFS